MNQNQHPRPLRKVVPLRTEPIVVPVLGLSCEGLTLAGCAPGAMGMREPAPAGEASRRRSFLRGGCSSGPSSAATATAAF